MGSIALALSHLAPSLAFGDSPLTSTDWHLAYADVTEVTRRVLPGRTKATI